ncbi:hypothetical protein [Amycolatopsis sp. CA-230715]|uniref:hypothetical protein n=1 Tax=Amycolatopsis sp. CA-230715 TaxID=2745196 RepID=UPI001C023F44|nr:hypothetical protein [Amycolatopsis sp. CA-230715]QWF80485.1 hypothetical protein HUW46_03908 [Amycolatopsis sp. CA-230715]
MTSLVPQRQPALPAFLGLAGLSLLGLPPTLFIGGFFVMGSDGCFSGDQRFICSVAGQQAAFYAPVASWGAAVVASFLVGLVVHRKGGSPLFGLLAGLALWPVGVAIGYSIAAG